MRIDDLLRLDRKKPACPPRNHAGAPRALPARIADWPEEWKFRFEERAAIMEFHGDLPRNDAEGLAEADVRKEFRRYAQDTTTGLLCGEEEAAR